MAISQSWIHKQILYNPPIHPYFLCTFYILFRATGRQTTLIPVGSSQSIINGACFWIVGWVPRENPYRHWAHMQKSPRKESNLKSSYSEMTVLTTTAPGFSSILAFEAEQRIFVIFRSAKSGWLFHTHYSHYGITGCHCLLFSLFSTKEKCQK